ncbi:glycosyltransferase family 4 protein [candidate division KSB1 bacterium]|nr:glycosyltransferase family 4 protein [candidate division KSB1 bacterium]NIV70232.1 glycosyltransferase [Phycisphaerae bacterium]NIS26136.1 glycosyltransferase family 4 protein [candidate division KSB1 bacterium]NIT74282.1 glycosyltransferase family 4 protein [candidate division KSB1 bacterium]NIU26775.1 glycosyltransferase family 4 protein [candidate division KSB1 bacterium]
MVQVPEIFLRKPLVITLHRGDVYMLPPRGFQRAIVRYFLKRAAFLIAVSGDLENKLTGELGMPPKKIAVIDVGCDLSSFTPYLPSAKSTAKAKLKLPAEKLVVLFVGSIRYRKGLDILLQALSGMNTLSRLQLIVIGEGQEEEKLKSEYAHLNAHVTWTGAKPNHELPQWYAAADAFVLPSRSEGTPTVILEAMGSGTPVVATRVGGIPELINDGINGLLFGSENIEQLQECLMHLFDPALRERIAKQALSDVYEHSLERQIEKTVAIYRSVISKNGVKK